jgi:hypothetical protein
MKEKIIFILMIVGLFGCSTYNPSMSNYQNKNIRKFSNNQTLRKNVPPKKNGAYRHRAVTKDTFKYLKTQNN